MTNNKTIEQLDLKQYQPYGIPLLKLMLLIASISLAITVGYELIQRI